MPSRSTRKQTNAGDICLCQMPTPRKRGRKCREEYSSGGTRRDRLW